jgi:predicted amidohydrolase YtcJ
MDPAHPREEAVVIEGERILFVGKEAEARALLREGDTALDVRGMLVLPGLTDAHGHLEGLGAKTERLDLAGVTSAAEVARRVRNRARDAVPGEWIRGRGWDHTLWERAEFPTAALIDAVCRTNPVYLVRVDGHAALANTAAMRRAGIARETKDPEGGKILRDERGEPTGIFLDNARDLIERAIPAPTAADHERLLLRGAREAAKAGLAEVHDAGLSAASLRALEALANRRELPIWIYAMIDGADPALDSLLAIGPRVGFRDKRLTVRCVKFYADGALGSRGAALLEPYADDPGNTGLLVTPPDTLVARMKRASAAGFQVAIHAIGDRGVRVALDAIANAGIGWTGRPRIEHAQVIGPTDLQRFQRLSVVASMQPTHATTDMRWAEARLGPERIKGAYAWRSILSKGALLAFGSDFPVESENPVLGIYAAVTRQDTTGNPPGGWRMEEALQLEEAVRAFTATAAFAAFEEGDKGYLKKGLFADVTVLEGDLTALEPSSWPRVKARYTFSRGKLVWDRARPNAFFR